MPYVSMPNCWPARTSGGAAAAADRSGAGGEKAGLAAVSAAGAEVNDLTALSRGVNAGRFAGDHRLVTHGGQDVGLHDLAFDDGGDDAEHGFAGGKRGSLRAWPRRCR